MQFAFKLSIHGQRTATRFSDLVGLAQHAEAVGFDGIYVVDHLLLPGSRLTGYTNAPPDRPYFLDAWTSLAAIAQATRTVKVGPQVSPVGLRHPVFLAKWGATIDQISDGRLLMQLGAGHQRIEYDSHGFEFPSLAQRMGRLREGIEVIRSLWDSSEPTTYSGDHYTLDNVSFWPKPVQERVPIWLGGASQAVQHLVADVADGWTPAAPQGKGLTPQAFGEAMCAIRERAGRPISGGALFYAIVDTDRRKVDDTLSILRRRDDWAGFSADEFRRRAIALAGSPDDVVAQLREYERGGLEHASLAFVPLDDIDETRKSVARVAETIMPHFK